jgi:hypothetical protein
MPTGLPLLQSHPKTLSKIICSPTHKDNFMKTASNFAKYIFIPTASQIALQNPLELWRNAERASNYIEPTQTLSKINSSPTTAPTF